MGVGILRQVKYINSIGESIILCNKAPFILYKIEGVGGIKTNVQLKQSPYQDGYTYIDNNFDKREISMECGIFGTTPKEKSMLRRNAVKVLNPKYGQGTLQYESNGDIKQIKAICEEAPIFPGGKDNVSPTFQRMLINLICPDPFWFDPYESKEEIAIWMGDFEFELELLEEGIELGHRESSLIVNVNNIGDVPCGMRIEFTALASVVNPSIFNVYTQEYIKVKRTLQAGNKLIISTYFGNKSVKLFSNGVTTNVLNYIDLNSSFLQLDVGDNLLRYDAEAGIDNLEVSIYYRPQYVGV